MKKLLIIMTLFISSFFFISLKEAKAYEYTKEVDFSLMEDVLSLKEKLDVFVENDTTYSDYYFIVYNGTIKYYILPLDGSLDNFTFTFFSIYYEVKYSTRLYYGVILDSISFPNNIYSTGFYMSYPDKEAFNSHIILYTNFDLYFKDITTHKITYIYNDFQVVNELTTDNKMLTLYDVYLEYQEYLGNDDLEHKEEIEKLESFYTIIIEKLSYLSEEIVSNYIYLSIIVIFILIFVFLLIFRRHL